MNAKQATPHPQRPTRVSIACLMLTAAFVLVFPLFALYGYRQSGPTGVVAAAVAGGVCWLGAFAALLLVGVLRGGPQVLHGMLLGMLFRVGLPLAAGVLLTRAAGPLAEAGVFGMIVVYYLIGLTVETLLSVRLVQAPAGNAAKAS